MADHFEDWKVQDSGPTRSLFFRPADEQKVIYDRLRHCLTRGMSREIPKITEERIGRILVVGVIPHSLWGGTAAYRPVYFFFGDAGDKGKEPNCQACVQRSNLEGDNNLPIVSDFWRSRLQLPDGRIPKCWSRCPLVSVAVPKHSDCEYKPQFGVWSYRDVLVLSRMRLRAWSLMRREIVGTPGVDRTWSRKLRMFRPDYFTGAPGPDICSVVWKCHRLAEEGAELRARSKRKGALEKELQEKKDQFGQMADRYVELFGSMAWNEARVWKDETKRQRDGQFLERAEDDEQKGSEYGAVEEEKHVTTALREWKEKHEGFWTEPYRWLDAELCGFLSKDSAPLAQGAYLHTAPGSAFIVYFELDQGICLGKATLEESDPTQIEPLETFCTGTLQPYVDAYRVADQYWENLQEMDRLCPRSMRKPLLYGQDESADKWTDGRTLHDEVEKINDRIGCTVRTESESGDDRSTVFESRLKRARLLYARRSLTGEDRPARLALTTMGEMWRYVFGDAVRPQYADFERYQQLLRGLPDYRDHLTHSIQVFLLGCKIINALFGVLGDGARYLSLQLRQRHRFAADLGSELSGTGDSWEEFERRCLHLQWAIASLLHDFALPAAKEPDLVEGLFGTFLNARPKGKPRGTGLERVLADNRGAYQAFLYGLVWRTQSGQTTEWERLAYPGLAELAYQKLRDDHGFLSAVFLFNQLFEPAPTNAPGWWRLKKHVEEQVLASVFHENRLKGNAGIPYRNLAEVLILEALDAVVKHNIFAKESRLLFEEQQPAFKVPETHFVASQAIFESPLPGLLYLCDTVCDWGRIVFPDELRHHDIPGEPEKSPQPEISRPEGQVVRLDLPNKGDEWKLRVAVNYQWRLPYPYHYAPASGEEKCLRKTYLGLKREMAPYTPGFRLWEGCKPRYCPEGAEKDCPAKGLIDRFWRNVLMRPDANRLAFPSIFDDTFNSIEIQVQYYGEQLWSGTLGHGMGDP